MAHSSSSPRPHIVIFGTPVIPGNRGVMALGASLVDILSTLHPSADFVFHLVQKPWPPVIIQTRNGPVTVAVHTCRMALRSNGTEHLLRIVFLSFLYRLLPFLRRWIRQRSPWIKSIAEALLVGDIRGGDSFSDIYGLKRFLLATLPILSVILIRGKIVHFPQTYGPFVGKIARGVARMTLRRSQAIVARDTMSRDFAQQLIGPAPRVHLSPDVAFRLQPKVPESLVIVPPLPHTPRTLVGLNINGLVLNGGYSGKDDFGLRLDYPAYLKTVVLELLKDSSVRVLLVPHTYAVVGNIESDNDAATKFRAALPPEAQDRVHEVRSEHDQHEIKGVIGMTDFFIGGRMHACIGALSQCIPTVGVAYSRKFLGVFASVGSGKTVVDATSMSVDDAVALTLQSFRERQALRDALVPAIRETQLSLDRTFEQHICSTVKSA